MQLDPKRFEPKKIRWAISKSKNEGLLPNELEEQAQGHVAKLTAQTYKRYRNALAANNALDFDDLLLLPVQLLKQYSEVRNYWHHQDIGNHGWTLCAYLNLLKKYLIGLILLSLDGLKEEKQIFLIIV